MAITIAAITGAIGLAYGFYCGIVKMQKKFDEIIEEIEKETFLK